jgi:hypothetical protein
MHVGSYLDGWVDVRRTPGSERRTSMVERRRFDGSTTLGRHGSMVLEHPRSSTVYNPIALVDLRSEHEHRVASIERSAGHRPRSASRGSARIRLASALRRNTASLEGRGAR